MSAKSDPKVARAQSMAKAFVNEKMDGDEDALEAIEEAAAENDFSSLRLGGVLQSAKSLIGDSRFTFSEVSGFANVGGTDRGQMGAGKAVGLIVALTVAAIVTAFLLPIGVTELAGADLGDNASDGAVALWNILDVIIILAVFLFFVGTALAAT